jgi:prepilin-type N-terminal cleavage/methylation domain-containing protein
LRANFAARASEDRAFTVLELLIAVAIVAILAGLLIAVISGLRSRAQRVQCIANLKSLHVGTELFIQQNGSWPQIAILANRDKTSEEMAALWISALEPFSVPRKTWICPSIQNFLGNPDYTQPENARIDYGMTAFDDKPTSPHEWPRQPWFMERGDAHGNGNLIIFADGSVSDLRTEVGKARSGK